MQVLIVDDDEFMLSVLGQTLSRMGHSTVIARNGREAMEHLRQGKIHLVITDWDMPGMNGLELCRTIRHGDFAGYVYVIILTAREGAESRIEGLDAGADDFLNKPLDADELLVCLKTADRILSLETRDVALFALAKLAESRDPETGAHIDRVQSYTRLIARNLSPEVKACCGADEEYIRLLYQTSPLHDLGKVGIPDNILLKPGKLTTAEYEIMKTHTMLGAQTLEAALQRFPHARFLQMARDIAATHHEKFDGSGYPRGLAGEQIPLCGRIVALADVYDALTSRRVYKDAMTHEQAKTIILQDRGTHFDPEVVDAFLRCEQQILTVRERLRDESATIPRSVMASSATPSESYVPNPHKILVVEDDPVILDKLVKLLSTTGEPVFPAASIQEALNIFAEHCPHLVVSDWEMPGGDGAELCRLIRQHPAAAPVHFIMLTVHSDQESLLSAYQAGVNDFVAKPFNPEELLARVQAGLRTARLHDELAKKTSGLQIINAQLAAMNSRLDRLSITDELTGLFNRRHAMFRLEEQWALAERYARPLTVAMIDIDHFKRINDTHGHEAGDMILRWVATLLRDQTRGVDTVCRIGGEEFLIIFPSQTLQEASICAERFRKAVEEYKPVIGGIAVQVAVSIGLATRTPACVQFPDLLKAADLALYAAKNAGRNLVRTTDQIEQEKNMIMSKAPSTRANQPTKNPPIDLNVIRQRCGGDESFAAAVMERFRTQAGDEVDRIDEALANNQTENLRRAAHNLKSMAAYVSAEAASDLSKQIEQLARADQLDGVSELLAQLRKEIEQTITWLTEHAGSPAMVS